MLDKRGYKHTTSICNIIAFPQQKQLRERSSILLDTHNVRLAQNAFTARISKQM